MDEILNLIESVSEGFPSYFFILTLKAPITTAADDIHKHFSLFFRENKTMFKVNPLLDRGFTSLFSSKDKSKKLKCRLLHFLFGALKVNI